MCKFLNEKNVKIKKNENMLLNAIQVLVMLKFWILLTLDYKLKTKLVLVFKEIESKEKTMHDNFYSRSKAEIIINESDIEDLFKSIYTKIITSIKRSLGKDSGWIIHSVIDHCISVVIVYTLPSQKKF